MTSSAHAVPSLEPTEPAPYRLQLLGEWDLRGPDGRQIQSVLAQPKRLCLLAYLALSGEPVSRASVVAVFWADKDEERARNALAQALFYLRRSMGKSVIENLPGDRIRVPPEVMGFDAREVLRAHREGETPTGDVPSFFDGWNADDSQPVQEWLDGVRRRIASIAEESRTQLAATAQEPDPAPAEADSMDSRPDGGRAAPRILTLAAVALTTTLVVLTSVAIGWFMRGRSDVGDARALVTSAAPSAAQPIAILQPTVVPEDGLPTAVLDAMHLNLVHGLGFVLDTPGAILSYPFASTRLDMQRLLDAAVDATVPLRAVEIFVQVEPTEIQVYATLFGGAGYPVVEDALQCTYERTDDGAAVALPGRVADDIVAALSPGLAGTDPDPSAARRSCR